MKLEDIKQIAVIGSGAMGSQIAQIFAQVGGYNVAMTDVSPQAVNNGIKFINDGLKKYFVDKGKMTQAQMDSITSKIRGAANIADCVKGANLVVEAAYESIDVKKDIFKQLNQSASPETILATNTSNLNVTEIASPITRKDKVVGMHFFNPVAVMKLVEVNKGPLTSKETVDIIFSLAKKLGKEPIICQDFSFGFLANRAYAGMVMEAVQMLWERVASPEDIDRALKLGYNLPMGPFEMADYTGGWALWAFAEPEAMKALGPEKGHLHPLIRTMVRAGYTGGRGKKGIYDFYKEVMIG